MNYEITLKPDRNRPKLESELARRLADGQVPDSTQLDYVPWKQGEIPRIMLIVPPYTRIRRPLDVIVDSLGKEEHGLESVEKDREIVAALRIAGLNNLEEMKRAGVPLGLLRVGTAAKKVGYDVKVLDAVFEGWNQERLHFITQGNTEMLAYGLTRKDIANRITLFNPHIVGITIDYTHQWGNARELADLVKMLNEKTIVIIGGTHASGLPQDVLLDSPADYVVVRQADRVFPDLLDVLTGRTQKKLVDVGGVSFRKDGKIEPVKEIPFLSNIDEIAIPDLSLVNLDLYGGTYHSAGQRKLDYGRLLHFYTSIGCNVRCTFCAIPPTQGPWIHLGKKTLDDLLVYITRQGVREVIVEDDHLFHDPEWALTVFGKLEEYKLPWVEEGGVAAFSLIALLPFVSEDLIKASLDPREQYKFNKIIAAKRKGITTLDLIKRMAESGCYSLYLAVESANDEALFTAHKPTLNTKEKLTGEIVRMLHTYGINVTGGLMLGFVNPVDDDIYIEPRRQIEGTITFGKYLRSQGLAYGNPFIFTPLPGAPHFPYLAKSLGSCLIRNTDEGFSHEFGTIDAPNRAWTRDELNLMRVYSILQINGVEGYKQMIKTGTWPVGRN